MKTKGIYSVNTLNKVQVPVLNRNYVDSRKTTYYLISSRYVLKRSERAD